MTYWGALGTVLLVMLVGIGGILLALHFLP